ncbi:MAG: hybrid sensor histidine kinase/response regulator [Proteobacteria bacterium]|nr:hybrid sensor histidine kinase/response regulator [Pseudomonadota bacterium]
MAARRTAAGTATRAARERRQLQRLREQNRALRKTVRALMARVEREFDEHAGAFSWFQAAARLEDTVRLRTEQYESLNAQLTRELESRREIELALKQAKQLADSGNQAKTRFLAAASHDLRQPLNSAVLFLESMDDGPLAPGNRELLQRAKVALASLNNLLGTLLDSARLDLNGIAPRPADFPIGALLDRIGPEFGSVARSAGLELKFIPCRAWVRTDLHLLETIVRNFVSNAIRYTPRGRVLVGCRRRRTGLEICVYDTGVGIERQHLQRIFDEYYQVPSAGRPRDAGIGLGLSIVSRLARLLTLECAVQSRAGKGSRFSVQVPYGRATADGDHLDMWNPATGSVGERRALNVVVIDDHPDVLRGMAAILGKWGHRVLAASAATEAVVQLIAADLQPDLIISDYHLAAGAKGDQAIHEVQREFDSVPPALIITSDPDPLLRDQLQRRGMTVLAKPLNLGKLRAMLDRLPGRTRAAATVTPAATYAPPGPPARDC